MEVKKFFAATMEEALDQVKRQLGPEAVILHSRTQKKGLFSGGKVEITAAVSNRSMEKKKITENFIKNPTLYNSLSAKKQAEIIDKYTQSSQAPSAIKEEPEAPIRSVGLNLPEKKYIEIEEDVPQMLATDSALENVKKTLYEVQRQVNQLEKKYADLDNRHQNLFELQKMSFDSNIFFELFEGLVMAGLERRFAYKLIKTASFEFASTQAFSYQQVQDFIASEIMSSIRVDALEFSTNNAPFLLHFVGPSGGGKTCLAAKLAYVLSKHRKKEVGCIHLDIFKESSFDQLAIFCQIFGIPFRSVGTKEDFEIALSDFEALDAVILDTPGDFLFSTGNNLLIEYWSKVLAAQSNIYSCLVLPSNLRDQECIENILQSSLNWHGVFFTKLDSCKLFGFIYNIVIRFQFPVLGFSVGKKIPEDFEFASTERIASLILKV